MSERLRIFTQHLPARRRAGISGTPSTEALKLVLPYERRQKARQRAHLAAGAEVGIQLPRGTVLRGGDQLRAPDGTVLEVVAAREPVSTVWCRDLRRLAQVAYHLGNRHVALEIGAGWVRYLADHVLDAMVVQLGLTVVHQDEPFEPENGAYGSHDHRQGHGHKHDHADPHEHLPHSHGVAFHLLRHTHEHDA